MVTTAIDRYAHGVGAILVNLQSLELMLRLFLTHASGQMITLPSAAGQDVQETFLTNYMTLGELVDEYNQRLSASEGSFRIDRSVVAIRDALAHGRLLSVEPIDSPGLTVTMFTFQKPDRKGLVKVKGVEKLEPGLLAVKRQFVRRQAEVVGACSSHRGYTVLRNSPPPGE